MNHQNINNSNNPRRGNPGRGNLVECANANTNTNDWEPEPTTPTLIVWGDQDRIFPLELANRLKRHLGENAELVVMKNTGHGFTHEKPKEFNRHLKTFLLKSSLC
ncbi:hypothetical protein OROMI_010662 [Orobanche minor]